MNLEIINIGDELINGTSVNTNATWLCARAVEYSARVVSVTVIGDSPAQIIESLDIASQRAAVVIITGGLGPTSDDYTKVVTLKYFGGNLIPNHDEIERIRRLFEERGILLSERNISQGWVPDNATVYSNPVGTAPGMGFKKNGTLFVFLPGVPSEMKRIFDNNADEWFRKENRSRKFVYDEMMIIGIGESFVADRLSEWQKMLPDDFSLAFLPSAGLVKIRLSTYDVDTNILRDNIKKELIKAASLFPGNAFHTSGLSYENFFFNELQKKKLTVSVAESCTGGFLSHCITSVPGSSEIFRGGIVAYHNDIKTGWLDVPAGILESYGAVSAECVKAMSENILLKFNTDLAISVSGIAGPDGGTPGKPVGTVWIAVSDGTNTITKMFLMGSDRIRNIEKSAVMAMKMALNLISTSR